MIKGKAEITISHIIDIETVTRFYMLQSSTINPPAKPVNYPPEGNWKIIEPSYTSGSTNTLYFVDCTEFTNGSFKYSDVSKSSSYEAAKQAYNKATNVENRLIFAETQISQNKESIQLKASKTELENIKVGGRNLLLGTKDLSGGAHNSTATVTPDGYKGFTTIFGDIVLTPDNSYQDVITWEKVIEVEPDTDYVLSFYAKGTGTFQNFFYASDTGNGNPIDKVVNSDGFTGYAVDGNSVFQFPTDWARCWTKWHTKSNACGLKNIILCRLNAGSSGMVCAPKLEKGNVKPSDWTPAPEDMATADGLKSAESATDNLSDTMTTRIEQVESTITQVADSISMMVVDQNGSSLMEQTANGWVFSMGETLEQLQKATDDLKQLESSLDDHDGSLTALQNVVKGLEELHSYVRITVDGNQPCIELGNDSSFKLAITNTGIKMMDGSTVPAYVTNQSLKISKAEIEDELTFGGFAFSERSNGNMGLIWKGE